MASKSTMTNESYIGIGTGTQDDPSNYKPESKNSHEKTHSPEPLRNNGAGHVKQSSGKGPEQVSQESSHGAEAGDATLLHDPKVPGLSRL